MTDISITKPTNAVCAKLNTFRTGDRIETVVPIELPDLTVKAGTKGWIIDVDPEQPDEVLFRPDQSFPELEHWNYLVPASAGQVRGCTT
jgi:hypothetical protein